MSEKVTAESVAARLYRYCKREYDCPHPSEEDVASELAAAEERGRRSGVEEAAKECELRIASWDRLRDQPTVAARVDEAESLAEIIRCLAPRDSGKVIASGHAEETDREDRRDDRWANPDLEDRK